jgi:hypothetical protein
MTRVIAPILFVWAGVLLGVSFIATPAKFLAPSLPMVQALDVGRWTFHVLSLVEWGFAAASAILLVIGWRTGRVRGSIIASIAVVVLILAAETFALRPLLDARVRQIMSGEGVPPTRWHKVYIALDALRLILILSAGICSRHMHYPTLCARSLRLCRGATKRHFEP